MKTHEKHSHHGGCCKEYRKEEETCEKCGCKCACDECDCECGCNCACEEEEEEEE